MICAEVRKRFTDKWTQHQLLIVKAEIQAIVEAAVKAKKTKARKTAAALDLLDSEAILSEHASDPLSTARLPINIEFEPDLDLDVDPEEVLPSFAKKQRSLATA
jgi:putative transposase